MPRKPNLDHIEKWHAYNLHVPARTIWMGSHDYTSDDGESGTDYKMCETASKNLFELDHINHNPITIIMNNLGGDVYHGNGLVAAIRLCESHVTVQVRGSAMSMGAQILQIADLRVMEKEARLMIHYGEAGFEGHAKTFIKHAEEVKRLNKEVEDCFIDRIREKHPKFRREKLYEMLDHDTFLSAQECVDLGLADKTI